MTAPRGAADGRDEAERSEGRDDVSELQLDSDYDRYDAPEYQLSRYIGNYRFADYRRQSGNFSVMLATVDGKTHIDGVCNDLEKAKAICDLWVREGRISDDFYKLKD